MIRIELQGDASFLAAMAQSEKQARFALSVALNQTAKAVIVDQRKEMQDVFDRPTPWTLNSLRQYGVAKRDKLETEVDWRANFGKGIQPDQYMMAQVTGGARRMKRYEVALRSVGALPDDHYTVPGEGAKLDAYGNISAGQIIQILSYFKAFPEMGYKSNATEKTKARLARDNKRTGARGFVYFVGRPGDRGQLGLYKRTQLGFGSSITPILIFVKSANYEARFDIEYVAAKTLARELQPAFDTAFAAAMATAK
ncbi:hypothetical protein LNV23_19010 [Paucibacter sp. DJ1R-11]|uniref:hypothetical protein n=1 Tax=Paucibacter sp. DJ1R-11 TaxID=2893556 RepID=UPI0021E3D79A|nr:hypothetical protein [Paucibacter sp. DJ1R-11]MCV2365544.1 hypothetical protein [Paucibacter sp. DJ1R-11]